MVEANKLMKELAVEVIHGGEVIEEIV